jgi:2-iminobutanoate/2-iminopropanoate deaminase
MSRKTIQTDKAPKAIGPYSQAVQVDAGKITFLSGQIPLDPKTGELIAGDVVAQTERVMENLKAVLAAAGLDLSHVVRCGLFLTDLGDFAKVNETYGLGGRDPCGVLRASDSNRAWPALSAGHESRSWLKLALT